MKLLAIALPLLVVAAWFSLNPLPGPNPALGSNTAFNWKCNGTFSGATISGECDCDIVNPPANCQYSVTITPAPWATACGDCHWSFSWSTSCPPCSGGGSGSGDIDLHCDPHHTQSWPLQIRCPTTSQLWLTYTFDCPYCS